MKFVFLALIFSLFYNLSLAKKTQATKKMVYKLSYEQYIERYGIDDTSVAIIDLFFDKRDYSATGQMSFLPLSTAVVAIAPPIGVSLMAISTPLFVSGLLVNQKYSHKNLTKALYNYQNKNVLSKKHRKKIVNLMQAQAFIHMEDLLEAQTHFTK